MTDRARLFLVNDSGPRLSPSLAREIGLNESILLLQIEFWIASVDHHIDGRYWTYQSVRKIQETFRFWSIQTINRIITSLVNQGLIDVANHNKLAYDRTRWLALNEEGIRRLTAVTMVDTPSQNDTALSQTDTGVCQDVTPSTQSVTPIPKTITKNTTIEHHKIYGEFQNVRLTDEEHQKLVDRFGDVDERIEKLSAYKKSKGKSYRSDYATILTWARRDNGQKGSDTPRGHSQRAITQDANELAAAWRDA